MIYKLLMKNLKLIAFLLVLSIFSCEKNASNQEDDLAELQELKTKITAMAKNKSCEESSQWDFIALGNKACGGPKEYIAYSKNIEVSKFLNLVDQYTKAEKAYNQKWKIGSDCSVTQQPSAVVCVDGNPTFEY